MKKLITTPVKLDNGQVVSQLWVKRNEDPVGFDTKMAYLHAIGFFDGKAGDRFIKAANTKAASGLQNWLTDNKGRNYGSSLGKSFNSKSGSTDPLDAALGL
jgi:hypothetical protein